MSAVVLLGFSAHWSWNSVQSRARASSHGRNLSVDESQTRISSWCRRWGRGTPAGAGEISNLVAAARDTAIMIRRKERGVTGSGGTDCCLLSSFDARMASIRSKSEAEQRDWEMETKSAGSGTTARSPRASWYWEQARWNEDTAMQERCFGWAFILARKVSIFATAVWNTSDGKSYQTLRQRRTCADPSRIPGDIPLEGGEDMPRPPTTDSPASKESNWPKSGWTSITT